MRALVRRSSLGAERVRRLSRATPPATRRAIVQNSRTFGPTRLRDSDDTGT